MTSAIKRCFECCLAAMVLVYPMSGVAAQEDGPTILIDVNLNTSANVQAWEVTWKATGLDSKRSQYSLQLEDWGEWSRADSLFLRNLSSNVRLRKQDGNSTRFKLQPPKDWDGSIQLSYRIMMMDGKSSARESFGLMPWYMETYGHGFTSNTLMDLFDDGEAIQAKRTINFRAKPDHLIVSGWGESSKGTHQIRLDRPIGNTAVVFGVPVQAKHASVGGAAMEVVQFGDATPFLDLMTPSVVAVFKSFKKSTGFAPINTKIIFTDTQGGGTNVEGAMVVGYDRGGLKDPNLLMTMAHELFHEWLGNGFVRVKNPEAVWFQEGFTDYLSLWHLAQSKQMTYQQFVNRIWQLNEHLADNQAKGAISFGDSNVNWRDGDGANEQMAYKGGAVLAFCTDVELRKAGHVGLSKMISDFGKLETSIGNVEIMRWYHENGLAEFHSKFIAQPNFVDVEAALKSIGCEYKNMPLSLPYAGFKNDNEGHFGLVAGVDPNGPAAKAGLKKGDRILGFESSVSRKELNIVKERMPEFNYGFTLFPINEVVEFGIFRDGKEMSIKITPKERNDIATIKGFRATGQVGKFFNH